MKVLFTGRRYAGMSVIVVALLTLGACGGSSKATEAPSGSATTPAAAAAVATTAPTATVVVPTPTPLPTATPQPTPSIATTTSATTTATGSSVAPPSDPKAQAVVDKARTRFDQVNTLHFALNVEGDVYLDKLRTQKLKSADGDLIRPNKVSLSAKASVGPVNAQLKFIQIGDDAYLTNILTGKWEKAPSGFAYDPRLVFDQDRGVSAILGKVTGWTLVGTEKVNGADAQHVRGPVPTAIVNDLVSASLRGDTVDVDLFVEGKNNDVVRLVLSEQPAAVVQGTTAAKWILDLSKQNDNLKIDPPTLGS